MSKSDLNQLRRLVIKIGSSLLIDAEGRLDYVVRGDGQTRP